MQELKPLQDKGFNQKFLRSKSQNQGKLNFCYKPYNELVSRIGWRLMTAELLLGLAETARTVRDNNDTPVAPSERVFPQHLIGVAIDLLRDTDIDWSTVRTIEDLRQQIKL